MVKLVRAKENPILTPTNIAWENWLIFNAGSFIKDDKVHLLYRAMSTSDPISWLGLAISEDGIHFERNPNPVFTGGELTLGKLGAEDPRVVKIDETFYIAYTAVSRRVGGELNPNWKEQQDKKPQIALSSTKDFINFKNYDVIIPDVEGKNASLFPKKVNGKYWLIYRINADTTYFSSSPRLDHWPERTRLFDKRPGYWDSIRVGLGAPPIETEKGWLIFYHGVDEKKTYRLGVMFLDLNNPLKILYRSPEPLLEPEADYEIYGFIPNVVFTCGAIERDGKYFVYYGAGDQVLGLATIDKAKILGLF